MTKCIKGILIHVLICLVVLASLSVDNNLVTSGQEVENPDDEGFHSPPDGPAAAVAQTRPIVCSSGQQLNPNGYCRPSIPIYQAAGRRRRALQAKN